MSADAAAVLGSLVEAASPKTPPLIATDAELDARLTDDAGTQRQVLRDMIEQELLPLRTVLQDPGGSYRFTAVQLAALQQDPSAVTWITPDIAALNTLLPRSTPQRMDHKLGRFYQLDIRNAARIVADYIDSHSWSFPTNRKDARKQFLELLALKDFYWIVKSASDAARFASVSLADALALFRQEGDLIVPMPQHYLDKRIPPVQRDFDFYFTEDAKIYLKPTMQNGLWSFPKNIFHAWHKTATIEVADKTTWQDVVKFTALLDWHLVVAGFDYIFSEIEGGAKWLPILEFVDRYIDFSVLVRTANGLPVTRQARMTELQAQLDNLKFSEDRGRLVIAPLDPALLLSDILTTALLFMKLAGKQSVRGPFISPRPDLNYLAHHTSDTRDFDDPREDKFSWMIASAGVALAAKTSAPAYCKDAYSKLRTLGLPGKLPGIPRRVRKSSVAYADAARAIKGGLTTAELDELALFMLRAGAADWGPTREPIFGPSRAGIARYARLHAYYQKVAPP